MGAVEPLYLVTNIQVVWRQQCVRLKGGIELCCSGRIIIFSAIACKCAIARNSEAIRVISCSRKGS